MIIKKGRWWSKRQFHHELCQKKKFQLRQKKLKILSLSHATQQTPILTSHFITTKASKIKLFTVVKNIG
jgi:hypothetical protein